MTKHCVTFFILMLLTACTGAGAYKSPSASGDPARMSADTLCYRAAYGRADQALRDEIAARNLDCRAVLEQQARFNNATLGGGF